MATRWTQHPADDLKGYGIGKPKLNQEILLISSQVVFFCFLFFKEDQKFNYDAQTDILEQFRTEINYVNLNNFLKKSSRVNYYFKLKF